MKGRLTPLDVWRLGAGFHPDGDGLHLQVTGATARSWIYRYTSGGRTRDYGVGPAKAISLKRARELAAEARRLVAEGIDPIERRREQRSAVRIEQAKAMSFRQCAEAYVRAHESAWRSSKHHQQWAATLAYLNPLIGPLPVTAIDVGLVLKCVSAIWTEKPVTAGRVRARLESILDFARARGFRDGENPARWRGHLDHLLPKTVKLRRVEHFRALPYDQIGTLMRDLRAQTSTAARCLEFTILTAARSGEALGARCGEFDPERAVWVVPATRMKAAREHRVPLSARAVAIICEQQARRESQYVFSGTRPGAPLGNMSLLAVLRKVTNRADVTVHGTARASFKTWAAERTAFPRELIEAALAHIVGDETERAYQRGDLFDKRAQLMTAWAAFCERPAQTATGKIVACDDPQPTGGAAMPSAVPQIQLPVWMPSDAQRDWIDLHSIVARGRDSSVRRELQYMLQRFATRPAMEDAWVELARLKKFTPSDLLTRTFLTYSSAFRIRPLGARRAPNTNPAWREQATQARRVADVIRPLDTTIRVENGITDATQTELDRVANFLEGEVKLIDELISFAPVPRKSRARKAQQVAFVDHMCNQLRQPIGRRPYTLVAILANVTFDVSEDNEWDADRVKKCYASRSRSE